MVQIKDVCHPDILTYPLDTLWQFIISSYEVDESQLIPQLIQLCQLSEEEKDQISTQSQYFIEYVRSKTKSISLVDKILLEYGLNTDEGIALMCLAESLIRIPDNHNKNNLICDKLNNFDWSSHKNASKYWEVNSSTTGLILAKRITQIVDQDTKYKVTWQKLISKFSLPLIREMTLQIMNIIGKHFILGRTIDEAFQYIQPHHKSISYSFDMLGEAAITKKDAAYYYESYKHSIDAIYQSKKTEQATVSIKLTALFPRYDIYQEERVLTELFDIVLDIITYAKTRNIGITIDAEESDRLELSLKLFEKIYQHPNLKDWGELGLAVQMYSKRAIPVLIWLAALAKKNESFIPVRLVKGAYWDNEIKWAQLNGQTDYPVFTRKEGTDISYLAAVRLIFSDPVKYYLRPQFATHNAHTIAAISVMATHHHYEFQRLHGMAQSLHEVVQKEIHQPLRLYAPVGEHKDLLPYLVRRLLENGVNSSFIHHLLDEEYAVSDLIQCPVDKIQSYSDIAHPCISRPPHIFGTERQNSKGFNLHAQTHRTYLDTETKKHLGKMWQGHTYISGKPCSTDMRYIYAPSRATKKVGETSYSSDTLIDEAITLAEKAFKSWSQSEITLRCDVIVKLADLMEEHQGELMALCHLEAGKTIQDSIDEIREAVDFCRYYSMEAKKYQLLEGYGVFACISPWNFPLAIFIGQICAALLAGNTVVAKPAPQTPLIAIRVIQLLFKTGLPHDVIHVVMGEEEQGEQLISDPRIAGVAFTGSMHTAKKIHQNLFSRLTLPAPFIAETGGQNAMIVDSTALPEQVTLDILKSAFTSAGQRCSALRVLYLQHEIADDIIELIQGALQELHVGLPEKIQTDIGPVIDAKAKEKLLHHIDVMHKNSIFIGQTPLAEVCQEGHFIPPTVFEIEHIRTLKQEHFGPVLHVIRYHTKDLDQIIKDINETDFGLTLGIHTRNESVYQYIAQKVAVGNCYINRDQIGAVVGVQPFGGRGLSGTGPKAGGPHYLPRFSKTQRMGEVL